VNISAGDPAIRSLSEAVAAAREAVRRGDWLSAATIAEAALAAGLEDPMLLNIVAWRLEGDGQYVAAGSLLSRALELAPSDIRITFALGRLYKAAGHPREAIPVFDDTIRLDDRFVLAWREKGVCLEMLGESEAAETCYRRAVELDPRYPDGFAGLSSVAAQRGDVGAAREHAAKALALRPLHSAAVCALATADLLDHDYSGAEGQLRPLLASDDVNPQDRAVALSLLAGALDGQDRCAEAFAAYGDCKAAYAQLNANRFAKPGVETHLGFVRRLSDWFDGLGPVDWGAADAGADSGPAAGHVFLVGYPRSGTTLLENALAGHPDVCALEEKPTLEDADRAFLGDAAGLQRLLDLGSAGAAEFRDAYWRRVREHGGAADGKVFIDKSPSASASLPLIRKLFPGARILVARRDPRDVVLSCFRQPFKMNPVTYEFTGLERAARHYDALMALAEAYLRVLPIQHHLVDYRRLVADFDGTTRDACTFIGVDWTEGVRDFGATARRRNVASSSARQVQRPLYDGSGQWRRYQAQLEPVLPILEPWVQRFGFDPS